MAGLALGLALSPFWPATAGLVQISLFLALIIAATVQRGRVGRSGATAIVLAATLAGLTIGAVRIDSIDDGALRTEPGRSIEVAGFVLATPRHSQGLTRLVVGSDQGKVLFETPDPAAGIGIGSGVSGNGEVSWAPGWMKESLRRQGIAMVLHVDRVNPTGRHRTGLTGWIDRLRDRAEAALQVGMPTRESSLARGFVLGEDDTIDPATVRDFQNSGLAHLLAVSGQNVVLLALLLIPLLAITGFGIRTRLLVVVGAIALYVPLAGAGASIQRAGAMGIAGLLAAMASRPASRIYGLVVAVVVTLAINPRSTGDVGWQLSFAAVLGIYLLAGPLRDRMAGDPPKTGWKASAIEAAAITIAATLATAPLMAFHFEQIPVATLLANLMVVPAVAPAMWLGMLAIGVGQISPVLAAPFNWVDSILLGYVAEVANWFGSPSWAVLDVKVGGAPALVLIYLVTGGLAFLFLGPLSRRRNRRRRRVALAALALIVVALVLVGGGSNRRHLDAPVDGGARIEILDIGQGDAILLRPDEGDPVLIDGGPPGGDLEGALESAGVDRLSAVIATHEDLDHVGGLYSAFADFPTPTFLYEKAPADLIAAARAGGATPRLIGEGDHLTFGDLEMEILWPPDVPVSPGSDPNDRAIVGLLRWKDSDAEPGTGGERLPGGDFRMLLTGDAEAEAAPVDPSPVDVLKVAHHGSDDAGLPGLLATSVPKLAVISVGADNTYGHPTPSTLSALSEAGVGVLRTDTDGTVSIVLGDGRPHIETGR